MDYVIVTLLTFIFLRYYKFASFIGSHRFSEISAIIMLQQRCLFSPVKLCARVGILCTSIGVVKWSQRWGGPIVWLCYCYFVICLPVCGQGLGPCVLYYHQGRREVGGEGEASSSVFLQLASCAFQTIFLKFLNSKKWFWKCFSSSSSFGNFCKHYPKSLPPAGIRHVSTAFW